MAMVICRQSLYRPPVFHFSPTKDFALLLMGMLNLLYFLIVLFGTVSGCRGSLIRRQEMQEWVLVGAMADSGFFADAW